MAAAQAGDARCYERLLKETSFWLRRYYARLLPASMIDDAAQDGLVAAHGKRHTYDGTRPFGPWLAAIARYKWIDRLRTLRTTPPETLSHNLAADDQAGAVTSAVVLERLLGFLKPSQSVVIRLIKPHGYSIEEASMRTGQSASSIGDHSSWLGAANRNGSGGSPAGISQDNKQHVFVNWPDDRPGPGGSPRS
jgi:DNA-directed RNA polymerase specialized sigma24 family protein